MRQLLRDLPARDGVTVFVSSHALAEVDHIATHVGLMHEGRLLLQAPMDALRREHRRRIEVETSQPDAASDALRDAGIAASREGGRVVVACDADGPDAAAVNALLVSRGIRVHGLSRGALRLESLFHAAIEEADHAAAAA